MFKVSTHAITLFIGALIVFWLMRGCSPNPDSTTIVKTKFVKGVTVIKIDTVKVEHWHRSPKADTVYLSGTDTLRHYTTVNADSSGMDSTLTIVEGTMISQLTHRECYKKTITRVDTILTQTSPPQRGKLFWGMYVGQIDKTLLYGLQGSYMNKCEDVFTISVNPLQKSLMVGAVRKIRLRR